MKVVFSEGARRDFADAMTWYQNEQVTLGEVFERFVLGTIRRMILRPTLNSQVRPGIYRALVPKFPYSIFYSIETDHLLIHAIAHQHRRPFAWVQEGGL